MNYYILYTYYSKSQYILKKNMSHEFIDTYLATLKRHRRNSLRNANNCAMTSTQMAFKLVRNTGIYVKMRKKSREQLTNRFKLS
mgnify:CR=1 FL=1